MSYDAAYEEIEDNDSKSREYEAEGNIEGVESGTEGSTSCVPALRHPLLSVERVAAQSTVGQQREEHCCKYQSCET